MNGLVDAIQARLLELEVARRTDEIGAATRFRAVIVAVDVVKRIGGAPGKAQLTLDVNGDTETIETDWLDDPVARHVARTAKDALGRRAWLYKHNQPDPTGKVPQGFRRVVWIDPEPPKA